MISAMSSEFRSFATSLILAGGLVGLAVVGAGCQRWGRSDSNAKPQTDVGRMDTLDALSLMSSSFGGDPDWTNNVRHGLPDSLKDWVGKPLTCVRILEAGEPIGFSGLPSDTPNELSIPDQGKPVKLKIPGPNSKIVVLSNGEIWGGFPQTFLARFYTPEERERLGQAVRFVVIPRVSDKTNALLNLETQMIRAWQRASRFEVVERTLRFTSTDGRDVVEFQR